MLISFIVLGVIGVGNAVLCRALAHHYRVRRAREGRPELTTRSPLGRPCHYRGPIAVRGAVGELRDSS